LENQLTFDEVIP